MGFWFWVFGLWSWMRPVPPRGSGWFVWSECWSIDHLPTRYRKGVLTSSETALSHLVPNQRVLRFSQKQRTNNERQTRDCDRIVKPRINVSGLSYYGQPDHG